MGRGKGGGVGGGVRMASSWPVFSGLCVLTCVGWFCGLNAPVSGALLLTEAGCDSLASYNVPGLRPCSRYLKAKGSIIWRSTAGDKVSNRSGHQVVACN